MTYKEGDAYTFAHGPDPHLGSRPTKRSAATDTALAVAAELESWADDMGRRYLALFSRSRRSYARRLRARAAALRGAR